MKDLLTLAEAAPILNVSPITLRVEIGKGRWPEAVKKYRQWFLPKTAVVTRKKHLRKIRKKRANAIAE